ncbi:MAG TPA: PAS domain S-box protein [Methylophaga sp.]|nr:PAS domain S-box protein [Methylophaga sp.]
MKKVEKSRKELGNKIKLARIQANLSQGQLAAKIERTGASIAYLEQGKRSTSTDILLKIADATSKPITFFFEDNELNKRNLDQFIQLSDSIEHIKGLLEKSENKYKDLLEQSPDLLFVYRIDNFDIVEVNQRACNYYGYSRAEFKKMNIFDIEMKPALKEDVSQLYESTPVGELLEAHGIGKKRDGTTFPIHVRFTKLSDEFAIGNVRNSSKL